MCIWWEDSCTNCKVECIHISLQSALWIKRNKNSSFCNKRKINAYKPFVECEVLELVPPRPVIVAVLEMSLLGDGFFTRGPLHSSTSSASRPVFKRCQCEGLRAQTCDLSLASLSGSATTSITHNCASASALM